MISLFTVLFIHSLAVHVHCPRLTNPAHPSLFKLFLNKDLFLSLKFLNAYIVYELSYQRFCEHGIFSNDH